MEVLLDTLLKTSIPAAILLVMYLQERSDRKAAEKALLEYVSKAVDDKIADRDANVKVVDFANGVIEMAKKGNL